MAGRTPRRPELRLRWRARRLTRPLLLVVVPAAAALAGLYWYAMSGRYVATDNAYVKADIVAISPDVDGRVIAVEVAENQLVQQGDLLFRLDPEPIRSPSTWPRRSCARCATTSRHRAPSSTRSRRRSARR